MARVLRSSYQMFACCLHEGCAGRPWATCALEEQPPSWMEPSNRTRPAGRNLPAGRSLPAGRTQPDEPFQPDKPPTRLSPTRRKSFRAENRRMELLITPLFCEFLPGNAITCGRMDAREGARVAPLLRRRSRCRSSSVPATSPLPQHSPPLFETSKCRWRRRLPSRNPQREAQGRRRGTSGATVGS